MPVLRSVPVSFTMPQSLSVCLVLRHDSASTVVPWLCSTGCSVPVSVVKSQSEMLRVTLNVLCARLLRKLFRTVLCGVQVTVRMMTLMLL